MATGLAVTDAGLKQAPHPSVSIQRVALILQSTSLGGMETHCADVAAEFVRRGLDVIVGIPDGGVYDELASRIATAGAGVHRFTTDGTAGRASQVRNLLRLTGILRRWRPDVVHLHTGGATGGFATIFVARLLTRRAAVITEHDVPTETPGLYQRALRAAMDRSADAIIAVSRRNAGLRTERVPPPEGKLAAVLNGAPTADIPVAEVREDNRRRLRAQLDIDSDRLVIGSLVRLAEGKGLHDLIRAFSIVRRNQAITLLLVGDGPLRSELESLAHDLGVSAQLRFAGHQAKATQYLDAMDVFVLAVPAGSMSMALLESMARGLPSVITYCGPEEPVIDCETGLCAPPSDPDGLAVVLGRISREPELRARLGRAAEFHVMQHFSVGRVADDLLELYGTCRSGTLPARLRANLAQERVGRGHQDRRQPAGGAPLMAPSAVTPGDRMPSVESR